MSDTTMDDRGLIVRCPSCGQRNRIGFATKEARCGTCKTVFSGIAEPIDVPNLEAFDALVRAYPLPVVVDFWAPWCGPCRMVAPELAKVAAAHPGDVLIVKVNTEAVPALGDRFRIRSIPTMALFRGGNEVARTTGAMPAPQIQSFIDGAMGVRP